MHLSLCAEAGQVDTAHERVERCRAESINCAKRMLRPGRRGTLRASSFAVYSLRLVSERCASINLRRRALPKCAHPPAQT